MQKLERSFASRRWCDHGTFSEPIMMHSLFVEWVRAGAPRGVKALGSFVRDWSIIPKKFESLTTDATDLTAPKENDMDISLLCIYIYIYMYIYTMYVYMFRHLIDIDVYIF